MVSVVMVAYNAERYIGDAIAGVVKQRRSFDVELLVLDDCSTDATADVVRRMDEKFPGVIRYVRNERNLGSQGNGGGGDMKEFESYPEVVAGLRDASTAIARSMLVCASDKPSVDSSAPYRTDREEAEAYAERFGIDVSAIPANAPAPSAPRRSVISRLIRRLSRLVPRPRP